MEISCNHVAREFVSLSSFDYMLKEKTCTILFHVCPIAEGKQYCMYSTVCVNKTSCVHKNVQKCLARANDSELGNGPAEQKLFFTYLRRIGR